MPDGPAGGRFFKGRAGRMVQDTCGESRLMISGASGGRASSSDDTRSITVPGIPPSRRSHGLCPGNKAYSSGYTV